MMQKMNKQENSLKQFKIKCIMPFMVIQQPEVIFNRVDSKKENIGLTNFKGNMPTKAETEIAKNYLSEKELDLLNRMVSAYLDVAEINALNMHAMTMKEWVRELDRFLTMTHKDILEGTGTISHEVREWIYIVSAIIIMFGFIVGIIQLLLKIKKKL